MSKYAVKPNFTGAKRQVSTPSLFVPKTIIHSSLQPICRQVDSYSFFAKKEILLTSYINENSSKHFVLNEIACLFLVVISCY